MFQYVIEIEQPTGRTYFHDGVGGKCTFTEDVQRATRFDGYHEAVKRIAELLPARLFSEPVQIRIVPSPESWNRYHDTWTMEEILRNAG